MKSAQMAAALESVPGHLDRWRLRVDGSPRCGMAALVLPVVCADGTAAALKLQPVDEESAGEPIALRAWGGDGAVRLLDHEPASGAMLLERLDPDRSLSTVRDDIEALGILTRLLARLSSRSAPTGLRKLGDVASAMLGQVPQAVGALPDARDRSVVDACAAAVRELVDEPGDRLLHWDLHYDNVLAGEREPWLVIDPKPLVGDLGFELLPALRNRWDDVAATGDASRAVLWRFDLMVEVLGLDRGRAVGWTLGRVLQNALWDVEDGAVSLDAAQMVVFEALLSRR